MTDPLLTLDDVARELTVSRRTVERLVRERRIRVVRPSPGRVAVTRQEIEAYKSALRRVA